MTNSEIYSLYPMRLELPGPAAGTSFPLTTIGPFPGQQSVAIKIASGGTARLIPMPGYTNIGGVTVPLSGITSPTFPGGITSPSGVTALAGGSSAAIFGWLLESGSPLSLNMRGPMTFVSSGATCVLEIVIGRTKGDWF